jgi:hypothetical protein
MGRFQNATSWLAFAAALAALACSKLPVGVVGTELLHGQMGVTVTGSELAYLDFEAENGSVRPTQAPILLVYLTIANRGEASVRYDTRDSATSTQQSLTPLLFADPGESGELGPENNIPLIGFSRYRYLGDPITSATAIGSGETLDDVLLFAQPPEGVTGLVLSLPPAMFGPGVELPALIHMPYQATAPTMPTVVGMNEDFLGDGFVFRLTDAQVSYPANADETGYTERPVLALTFAIRNIAGETITYDPPHRNATSDAVPELTDGNRYFDRYLLPADQRLRNQTDQRQAIAPETELTDIVVFERPDETVTELVLTVPGHIVGRHGLVRVRFPFVYSDPPLPEALRAPAAPEPPVEETPTE